MCEIVHQSKYTVLQNYIGIRIFRFPHLNALFVHIRKHTSNIAVWFVL